MRFFFIILVFLQAAFNCELQAELIDSQKVATCFKTFLSSNKPQFHLVAIERSLPIPVPAGLTEKTRMNSVNNMLPGSMFNFNATKLDEDFSVDMQQGGIAGGIVRKVGRFQGRKYYIDLISSNEVALFDGDGNTNNPTTTSSDNSLERVQIIMNLGIPDLEESTLEWHGNEFTAARRSSGLKFLGKLELNADGIPDKLYLTSEVGKPYAVIDYIFDTSTENNTHRPCGVPASFTISRIHDKTRLPILNGSISRLSLAVTNSSVLNPANFIQVKTLHYSTYSNNVLYSFGSGTAPTPVSVAGQNAKNDGVSVFQNWLLLVLLAAIPAAFIFMFRKLHAGSK